MKRVLNYFVILAIILFSSCNNHFDMMFDYTISNKASQTICFQIDDKEYSLNQNETITINKSYYDSLSILNHPRIKLESSFSDYKGTYTFYDLKSRTKKVYNSSNRTIILSEQKGMLGENYNDTITISPDTIVEFVIFTETPAYKAVFSDNNIEANLDLLTFF